MSRAKADTQMSIDDCTVRAIKKQIGNTLDFNEIKESTNWKISNYSGKLKKIINDIIGIQWSEKSKETGKVCVFDGFKTACGCKLVAEDIVTKSGKKCDTETPYLLQSSKRYNDFPKGPTLILDMTVHGVKNFVKAPKKKKKTPKKTTSKKTKTRKKTSKKTKTRKKTSKKKRKSQKKSIKKRKERSSLLDGM